MTADHHSRCLGDTERILQKELAGLKIQYLSRPSTPARDASFAEREAAIGDRFRKIGRAPSYPKGFRTLAEY